VWVRFVHDVLVVLKHIHCVALVCRSGVFVVSLQCGCDLCARSWLLCCMFSVDLVVRSLVLLLCRCSVGANCV
jgi:hypothetical protein